MSPEERLTEIYIESFAGWKTGKDVPIYKKKWGKHLEQLKLQVEAGVAGKHICGVIPELRKDYFSLKTLSKAETSRRKKALRPIVARLAEREISILKRRYSDEDIEIFLRFLAGHSALVCKGQAIEDKYSFAEDVNIEKRIVELVQTDPTVEYPKAREMTRHFHLHLGPTNSGKTHDAIESLKNAQNGVYLGPLRLLALEIYDTLSEAGVSCSMLTGEEHIYNPEATVVSQTIETLDITQEYDVAVIDEGQMIDDDSRGHAWSRAVLGVRAREVYVCASENVKDLLVGIIHACKDTYDIVRHERMTELFVEDDVVNLDSRNIKGAIQKGDCLIAFSKRAVLDLAARLEMAGFKASVIYGKLPPETRKREVARFTSGQTDVVVATDAIGMGVNLPIRRIILTANKKYDGREVRGLYATEVLQIAGRAGRFGIYDKGYVTSSIEGYNSKIKAMLERALPSVTRARLGFPMVLLSIDDKLDAIISTWESIKATAPYEKVSTAEMLELYRILKVSSKNFEQIPDGDDKNVLYSMISVPLDAKNTTVVSQWVEYCKNYSASPMLEFPHMPVIRKNRALEAYEDYYKLLDLYHMFSIHMGKEMDEEELLSEKEKTEERIEAILSGNKNGFVRRCMYCRKPLPIETSYRVCDDCHSLKYRGYSMVSAYR